MKITRNNKEENGGGRNLTSFPHNKPPVGPPLSFLFLFPLILIFLSFYNLFECTQRQSILSEGLIYLQVGGAVWCRPSYNLLLDSLNCVGFKKKKRKERKENNKLNKFLGPPSTSTQHTNRRRRRRRRRTGNRYFVFAYVYACVWGRGSPFDLIDGRKQKK